MVISILLGIVSSVVAEFITFVNKKLSGTVLKGNGAFLVIFAIALIGAAIKQATSGIQIANLNDFIYQFGIIFSASQVYFTLIATKLGLVVQQSQITQS